MDRRQRIIMGIVLVNLSIFLFSAMLFTEQGTVTSPWPLLKNKPIFTIFISNYFTEIILMLVHLGVAPQT